MKWRFFILICAALFACPYACDDDENPIGTAEASAACTDYCQKLFDCGVTLPTDQPQDEYQAICEDDCFDALTGATPANTVHFEIESKCCPLDCDTSADCGAWHQCCDSCG